MKQLFFIALTSLIFACNSPQNPIEALDEEKTVESVTSDFVEEKPNLLLQIPDKFMLVEINPNGNYQDSLTQNYWAYNNQDFEAKINNNESLIAINNKLANGDCIDYKSFLLEKDNNGNWINVFDKIFPELNIYSFYSFGDKRVNQLEGDEKTVFAGYKFHFDKMDSLGVQFMFCNKNSKESTEKLNTNGKIIYKAF